MKTHKMCSCTGYTYNVKVYLRVVYRPLCRSKGLSQRAQNLKKGGAWGAVGNKKKKWAKAPAAKVKKLFLSFVFWILEEGSSVGVV
jgi:hypothetical protein